MSDTHELHIRRGVLIKTEADYLEKHFLRVFKEGQKYERGVE